MNELAESFKKLFNEKHMQTDPEFSAKMKNKIDDYEKEITTLLNNNNIVIDNEEIRKIIKSLPNGKALGFAEVTNEMIKYAW